VVGIVSASWHFAYGLYLFAAKWGITVGDQARRRLGYFCAAVAILFITVGLVTVRAFFHPEWREEWRKLQQHGTVSQPGRSPAVR
jgi:succinate dehydrogenase / fumarate reductase cytochrome b subunit